MFDGKGRHECSYSYHKNVLDHDPSTKKWAILPESRYSRLANEHAEDHARQMRKRGDFPEISQTSSLTANPTEITRLAIANQATHKGATGLRPWAFRRSMSNSGMAV
jgi:hypothetical protein